MLLHIHALLSQLKTAVSSPSDDKTTFCPSTINKPVSQKHLYHLCPFLSHDHLCSLFQLLTVHYLELLVEALYCHSLHPLAFPVLHLQLVLAECVLGSGALKQLVHLRYSSLG